MTVLGRRDSNLQGYDEFSVKIQLPNSIEELQDCLEGFFINNNLQPHLGKIFCPGKIIQYHAVVLDIQHNNPYRYIIEDYQEILEQYSLREATFDELLAFVMSYYGYARQQALAASGLIIPGQTIVGFDEKYSIQIKAEKTVFAFKEVFPVEREKLGCADNHKSQFLIIGKYSSGLEIDLDDCTVRRFLTVKP